jgi:hypothetical protein
LALGQSANTSPDLPADGDTTTTSTSTTTQSSSLDPQPLTGDGRVKWAVWSTIGPASILDGAVSSGWGTLMDHPREYGTHWDGFGERVGIRFSSVAISHTMEAGLGAIWGEDPRYFRDEGQPFGHRFRHVVKMTFLAKNSAGETVPAYARYAGVVGSNFLSNAWRPDSEADASHAGIRIGLGFVARFTSNAFDEFWPDLKDHLFHHGR